RIVTTSSPGTLTVGAFAPFPFPPNVETIVEVGTGDATCKHTGIVPSGGFTVPTFCIPALAYSSVVEAKGCESGGASGSATVWDAVAPAPDPNVRSVADTSAGGGGAAWRAGGTGGRRELAGVGANPKSGTGSPADGPCCTVGQATTVVATGTAFSGAFPLYDLTFFSSTPTTISSCAAPTSSQTCTLTTDVCQD